jgi:CRP-like cAMP-binding protein
MPVPPKFSVSDLLAGPAAARFLDGFRPISCGRGEILAAGEEGEDGVFVLLSGRLRMTLEGDEREIALVDFRPGDMFSLHAGCRIEALEKCELRIADIATFGEKLRDHPELALALVSILGRTAASFLATIRDLMFRDVRGRIARFVGDRAGPSGELESSVEEIAGFVGASRQATSAALNALIREGVIERRRRGVYRIPDPARLATVVGDGRGRPSAV